MIRLSILFVITLTFNTNILASIDENSSMIYKRVSGPNEEYVGYFLNDLRHGKGTLTKHREGKVFTGEWDRGFLFEGTIKEYNDNGLYWSYEGEIKNYQAHGYGTMTWGKNTKWSTHKYVGNHVEDLRHGSGKYYFDSGYYNGQWYEGERTGVGLFKHNNGDTFIGLYKNSKKSNLGVQYKKNGRHYAGWWKNGKHASHLVKGNKSNKSNSLKKLNRAYITDQKSIIGGSICYYSDGTSTKIGGGKRCPRRN